MNKTTSNKRKAVTATVATANKIRKVVNPVQKNIKPAKKPIGKIQRSLQARKQQNYNQKNLNGKSYKTVVEDDVESIDDESNEIKSNDSVDEENNTADSDNDLDGSDNNSDNESDDDNDNNGSEDADENDDNDSEDDDDDNEINKDSEEENELSNTVISNNDADENDDNDSEDDDDDNEINKDSEEENELSNKVISNNDDDNDSEDDDDDNEINKDSEEDNELSNTVISNNDSDSKEEEDDDEIEENKDESIEDNDHHVSDDDNDKEIYTDDDDKEVKNVKYSFNSMNSVYLKNIKGLIVQEVFPDCNIDHIRLKKKRGFGLISFTDEESVQKALQKDGTIIQGKRIRVVPNNEIEINPLTILVRDLPQKITVNTVFGDCNIQRHRYEIQLNAHVIELGDFASVKKALSRDGLKICRQPICVEYCNVDYCISVHNLSTDVNLQDIFSDSKILHSEVDGYDLTIYFEDEDSVQVALLKHDTIVHGRKIKLTRKKCSLYVSGLASEATIEKVFNDCDMLWYNPLTKLQKFNGCAIVNLKNKEDTQKALQKNGEMVDDNVITVEYNFYMEEKYKEPKGFNKKVTNIAPEDKEEYLAKRKLLHELRRQIGRLRNEVGLSRKIRITRKIRKRNF